MSLAGQRDPARRPLAGRSKRGVSSSSSNPLLAALIADCDTFGSATASETLPVSAVAMKYRIWRNEITVFRHQTADARRPDGFGDRVPSTGFASGQRFPPVHSSRRAPLRRGAGGAFAVMTTICGSIVGPPESDGWKVRQITPERRVVSPILEGHLRSAGFRAVGPDVIYRWIANRPTSCSPLRAAVSHYRGQASPPLDLRSELKAAARQSFD